MIVREGSEVWLYVILWLMMIAAAASCLGMIVSLVGRVVERFVGWRRRRNADDAPWRQSDLYVDGDDWELWDVQWRRKGGRIEVEYGVANWLPGQHEYRNDFIRVFQRGIGLTEEGGRASRVLLKGAEIRFTQTFLARDDSTPVIQADSSYTESHHRNLAAMREPV